MQAEDIRPTHWRQKRITASKKISAYCIEHLKLIRSALSVIFIKNALAFFLSLLALVICLSLILVMYISDKNFQNSQQTWNNGVKIQLFLKPNLNEQQATELLKQIKQQSGVVDAKLISAENGLQELKQNQNLQLALDKLTENPLPNVIEALPQLNNLTPSQFNTLATSLQRLTNVDSVQYNSHALQYHYETLAFLQSLIYWLRMLLMLIVVIVMVNTLAHAAEITFFSLIYSGIFMGFLAGLITVGFIIFVSDSLYNSLLMQYPLLTQQFIGEPVAVITKKNLANFVLLCALTGLLSGILAKLQNLTKQDK